MKKVCFVTASYVTVQAFLNNHIRALIREYNLLVVTNLRNHENVQQHFSPEVIFKHISIDRNIKPVKDILALFQLYSIFRNQAPDLVHSVTPKAGLLGQTAAYLAHVPNRLHTYTGQVWANRRGLSRWMLKSIDCFFGGMSTKIFVDSHSQREFLIEENVISAEKSSVLADGSISGVNCCRFKPNPKIRNTIRTSLNIPIDSVLFVFLGRLNHDKGVLNLIEAFCRIKQKRPNIELLLVGPDEMGLLNRSDVLSIVGIHFVPYTTLPENYLAAADVLCLPSYREGFGTSIIEAAAVGLPVIASRIYGITDAVIENKTGLLHVPGDVSELEKLLLDLSDDPVRRLQLGEAARQRVLAKFTQERLTNALLEEYRQLLN